MKIKKGDTVIHTISNLYFICENEKHVTWMNMNPYYQLVDKSIVPEGYFDKN